MSKSVRLSASAASTGSDEEHADDERAPARRTTTRRAARFTALPPRASIQRRFSRIRSARASSSRGAPRRPAGRRRTDALGHEPHLGRDALPLRDLRRRLDALELLAKGARVRRRPRARGSCQALRRGGRSPVSAWKRRCDAGRDRYSISCHAARLVRATRGTRTRLEPPAIEAPGPSGPGSGAVVQRPAAVGRQPPLELADVPRPGDVEREVAAAELVPHVRDLRVGDRAARSRRGTCRRRTPARGGSRRSRKLPHRPSSRSSGSSCCSASASSGSNSLSGSRIA